MTNIDLVDFLRARLDEDYATAKAPTHATWATPSWEYHEGSTGRYVDLGTNHLDEVSSLNDVEMKHIARHDPARVLAEVEAKRRIVAEHAQRMSGWCITCDIPSDTQGREHGCTTVRLLALPYAKHPDYLSEEWRP